MRSAEKTKKEVQPWWFLLYVLFALLTATSFSVALFQAGTTVTGEEEAGGFIARFFNFYSAHENGYGIMWVVLAGFLFFFYLHYFQVARDFNGRIIAGILSFLFSLSLIFGRSFQKTESWDSIFSGKRYLLQSFLSLLGFFLFFFTLISILIDFFAARPKDSETSDRFLPGLMRKSPFLFSLTLIFLLWLPYLVAFYPGSVSGDAFVQLDQFYIYHSLSDHHPVFSSLIISICVGLGRLIKSDNVGMFLYTVIQSLMLAASFAYSIRLMVRIKVPDIFIAGSLFFYSLLPLFPGYGQYVTKDTLFSACFVFYIANIIELSVDPDKIKSSKFLFWFTVNNLLLCLLRHNGFYIWLLSVFFLFTFYKKDKSKNRLRLFASIGAVLLVFFAFSYVLLPRLHTVPGSKAEALSIPFQQTARFAKYHDNEVTQEERNIINRVLSYDEIRKTYNPDTSDPVKGTYRNGCTRQDLQAYFHVWWNQLLRHPGTYLQATIANSYGYFYPDAKDIWPFGTSIFYDGRYNYGQFGFRTIKILQPFRDFLNSWIGFVRDMPLVGTLEGPGIYTWVLAFLVCYCFYKKNYKKFIPLVPCFWTLMTCVASPVNRFARYYLPVMGASMLLVGFILFADLACEKKNSHPI